MRWILLLAAAAVLAPASSDADSRSYWEAREAECRGDLACMLRAVEAAEPIPQWRADRPAGDLVRALRRAGRFRELGLSDEEGERLVAAVYRKLGGRKAMAVSPPTSEDPGLPTPTAWRAAREFEELEAVLMRWPFDWPAQRGAWASMVSALAAAGVTIRMRVDTDQQGKEARQYLETAGIPTDHVQWVVEKTDSVWIRDYGPQFLYALEGEGWGVADFHYYPSRPADDDTPLVVATGAGVPRVNRQTGRVVYTEGGNLMHDGLGTVIYSRRTYLGNPGVPEEVVDSRILSAFQAHQGLVPQDPSLDSTGHVDMFLKVTDPATVVVGQYGPDQTDYLVLEEAAALFAGSVNGAGEPWRVVRIPQPDVYYIYMTLPVVRTYTNAFVANDSVLLPVYGIPEDEQAAAIFQDLLPGRTVYPIDATGIIASGGAWHCVTMEYPRPGNPR